MKGWGEEGDGLPEALKPSGWGVWANICRHIDFRRPGTVDASRLFTKLLEGPRDRGTQARAIQRAVT